MDKKAEHYKIVEAGLLRLLDQVSSQFADSNFRYAREFVEHGEYGLALETLVEIISEESSQRILRESYDLIVDLAQTMELDKDHFEQLLCDRISEC